MDEAMKPAAEEARNLNFLEEIIEEDLKTGKVQSVITRFPPEPNGYLHLGHAKSICLNFGLALKYGGETNLRYDDTNPVKEDIEYVDAIKEDISWMGFQWAKECYASDYFDQLYAWAEQLIEQGQAYVDDQTQEEISKGRGTVETPGVESPYRNRSVEENLRLFRGMKAGKYAEGEKVLRAKIDMASPNMLMRDPILYRIKYASHHRTGDKWCIYPMYDFTHGQCDSIERITHSICTLEFDVHRPLYDWFIEVLGIFPSHQYEFARLNLTYTLMSKRKLLELVQKEYVTGWDDPRMPTLCGVRRRGYTPESLKLFCDRIGVSKRDQMMDIQLLEWCVRQDLNARSNRYMVVQKPLKVTLTNWEKGKVEWFDCPLNPAEPEGASRKVPLTGELYIEQDDFMEEPPRKFFRLRPGGEVRLKYTYIIKCKEVVKDADGRVVELKCTYDPSTKPGGGEWRSVKGTIHWVSTAHAREIEIRDYDHLFLKEDMNSIPEDKDYMDYLNPDSLVVGTGYAEPALLEDASGIAVQFERTGYYFKDRDSTDERAVFNKTVALKDSYRPE
ncbi:MAG: glutamine--tRNA ligase/YqeY domain fusion protein [Bacteroidales bacterium]|jgi:glutaminyl-tRNA synthetase|nr:glutamine--tRNA ligase/YqeY domain fusion protein [Bacteroidota bacterium]NLN99115.1 glutamine--tRNA ligase/YqeY domain fusion protein [Bacteroidales bacterium]